MQRPCGAARRIKANTAQRELALSAERWTATAWRSEGYSSKANDASLEYRESVHGPSIPAAVKPRLAPRWPERLRTCEPGWSAAATARDYVSETWHRAARAEEVSARRHAARAVCVARWRRSATTRRGRSHPFVGVAALDCLTSTDNRGARRELGQGLQGGGRNGVCAPYFLPGATQLIDLRLPRSSVARSPASSG